MTISDNQLGLIATYGNWCLDRYLPEIELTKPPNGCPVLLDGEWTNATNLDHDGLSTQVKYVAQRARHCVLEMLGDGLRMVSRPEIVVHSARYQRRIIVSIGWKVRYYVSNADTAADSILDAI